MRTYVCETHHVTLQIDGGRREYRVGGTRTGYDVPSHCDLFRAWKQIADSDRSVHTEPRSSRSGACVVRGEQP